MASAAGAVSAAITLLVLLPLAAASDSDHKVLDDLPPISHSRSVETSTLHAVGKQNPPWFRASQRQRLAQLARYTPRAARSALAWGQICVAPARASGISV